MRGCLKRAIGLCSASLRWVTDYPPLYFADLVEVRGADDPQFVAYQDGNRVWFLGEHPNRPWRLTSLRYRDEITLIRRADRHDKTEWLSALYYNGLADDKRYWEGAKDAYPLCPRFRRLRWSIKRAAAVALRDRLLRLERRL